MITLYDSKETLFYCDPPYIHDTRGDSNAYSNEMTDEQHEALARVLNSVEGKVAISNYDCSLMDCLYSQKRWFKTVDTLRTIHSTKDKRREVLWTNYNPARIIHSNGLLF